jgi:glutathione S-transferase
MVGAAPTLADVFVAAPFTYAEPARFPLDGRPGVRAWLGRVGETSWWRDTAPPRG